MKFIQTIIGLIAIFVLITGSGCDSTSNEQVAGEQTADILECVVAGNICTRDINDCGNPSSCTCPDNYHYNGALGECLYDLGTADSDGTSTETAAFDGESIPQCALPPEGMCTRDINQCGNPSHCDCPAGYAYSPAAGECLLELR